MVAIFRVQSGLSIATSLQKLLFGARLAGKKPGVACSKGGHCIGVINSIELEVAERAQTSYDINVNGCIMS